MMTPLDALARVDVEDIGAVVFDLDDTVLDHGRLGEAAYSALFRMREVGYALFASTGRPAGWAEIVARQWPVDAALAENGAVAWVARGRGVELFDTVSVDVRRTRRARLDAIVSELLERFPDITLADDNGARKSDAAFDIGEHHHVEASRVEALRQAAHALGARTFSSSVHAHVTLDGEDKATGYLALASALGADPASAYRTAAFIGDSANDAPAFAAFGLTFGVANVERHRARLSVLPRFVARLEMGAGFAEIASRLCELRAAAGPQARRFFK
ncbi:MAG: HAD-IIB family hydrolase [Polyangiaceae bacterium]